MNVVVLRCVLHRPPAQQLPEFAKRPDSPSGGGGHPVRLPAGRQATAQGSAAYGKEINQCIHLLLMPIEKKDRSVLPRKSVIDDLQIWFRNEAQGIRFDRDFAGLRASVADPCCCLKLRFSWCCDSHVGLKFSFGSFLAFIKRIPTLAWIGGGRDTLDLSDHKQPMART